MLSLADTTPPKAKRARRSFGREQSEKLGLFKERLSSATKLKEEELRLKKRKLELQRDRSVFVFFLAANAGLSIITRFQPQNMAALCHEIPLPTLAVIKRIFCKTFGCDPFL